MEKTKKMKSIKKSVFQIISFGFVARIFGIINGFLLIRYISRNYNLDIYSYGTSPIKFMPMIVDGLILALILLYQDIEREEGIEGRFDFTNDIVNLFIIISMGIIVMAYVFAPKILKLSGNNLSGEELSQGIGIFRIGMFMIVFHLIRGVGAGYLQGDNRFLAGAKAGVFYGVIHSIYLLCLGSRFGLTGLILTDLLAVAGQAYILIKPLFGDGYTYRLGINLRNRRYLKLVGFLIPILVYIFIGYFNTNMVNGFIWNEIGDKAFSLKYGKKIIDFVYGLSLLAIGMVFFPVLAWDYNTGDIKELRRDIESGIGVLSKVGIVLSLVLVIFGTPLVKILYYGKGFNVEEISLIVSDLRFYTLGFIGMGLGFFTIRMYYGVRDFLTPIILGILSLGMSFVLTRYLGNSMGSSGVILSTSINSITMPILGIYILDRRLDIISPKTFEILRRIVLGTVGIGIVFIFMFFK